MGKLIFNATTEPQAPVGSSKHTMYVDSADGNLKLKDNCENVCTFATENSIYFGKGTEDIIISEDCFLCSNCVYEVNNFIICDGATLRFNGSGIPIIKANCFCNMGIVDMYTPGFGEDCVQKYITGLGDMGTGCICFKSLYNKNSITCNGGEAGTWGGCGGGYDATGVGAGGSAASVGAEGGAGTGGPMAGGGGGGYNQGGNGNQETGIGGNGGSSYGTRCCTWAGGGGRGMCGGGNGGDNFQGNSNYGGALGGNGGNSICGNGGCGGTGCPGGNGGNSIYGNGGNGGNGSTSCSGGMGGNGGNSVYGNGGNGGTGYGNSHTWGKGGCSLYGNGGRGGDGGSYSSIAGDGGDGRNGGNGGDSGYSCCYAANSGGNGGNAIGYNYPLGLLVKRIYNCGCILSCGGNGGNGGNIGTSSCNNKCSCGGKGSSGGTIYIYTNCFENVGCINTDKGYGGLGKPSSTYNGVDGKPGCLCYLSSPVNDSSKNIYITKHNYPYITQGLSLVHGHTSGNSGNHLTVNYSGAMTGRMDLGLSDSRIDVVPSGTCVTVSCNCGGGLEIIEFKL